MNLRSFAALSADLLPGLVNTALRNDCEDLDDLAASHDIDRAALEARLGELGYRYLPELNQFRSAPGQES